MRARAIWRAAEGRVRAPWRILLFLLLWVVASVVIMRALALVFESAERLTRVPGTGASLAMVGALLIAHAVMLHFDRRSFAYVGLQRAASSPRLMTLGFGLGAAPIGLASLLLIGVGWLAVVPSAPGSWAMAAVRVSLALLPAAFYEELMSRGYVFGALREWLGAPVAIGVTSVGFGLLHLYNPGATALSITTVILAGVFLAAVLVVTGSLYAAWMAHWAWNWVMAVPLHVAVSGLPLARPDYQTVDAGPDWATGGRWGPEGGASAAGAMIVGLVFLYMQRFRLSALGPPRSVGSELPGGQDGSATLNDRTAEGRQPGNGD